MKLSNIKLLVLPIALIAVSFQASADISVSAHFSKGDISIITEWYRDHGIPSTRGNGKKKSKGLPPGIAKNLARGKALPPGIAKQILPQELLLLLPAAPHGFERIAVDGKILLVHIATRVIHDILTDLILK
jgi:hypothetical protein